MSLSEDGEVLLVVRRYPHTSQTFIVNEFRALIDVGVDVKLLALRGINYSLLAEWPEAYATRGRVIAGSLGARRRYGILRLFASFFRAFRRGMVRYAFRRNLGARVIMTGFPLIVAAAFSRVGRFKVIHYQFGGIARLCFRMELPHHQNSTVFVSFRGKDITTTPVQELSKKNAEIVAGARCVLPVCNALKETLVNHAGFTREQVLVHYSGIDVAFFRLTREEHEIRDRTDHIQIYAAGRLTEKKGIIETIDSFARARSMQSESEAPIRLLIAGDGPLAGNARERVAELKLEDCVRFAGVYDLTEHRTMLVSSHIFLSHNVTAKDGDQEGIPNVIKEAMAAELPVIATVHSGTPELVAHDRSGILVPERDVSATADGILRLTRDPLLRKRFGAEGRRIVESRFDINVTSKQLRSYYREYT